MVAVYNWPLTASAFHSVGQAYKLVQRSTEPPIWIQSPRGAVAYLITKRRSTAEVVSVLLKMMFATTLVMSPVAEELMQLYWPPETVKSISNCKCVNQSSVRRGVVSALTSNGAPKAEETTIVFSGSLTRAGKETDPENESVAPELKSLSPKHI
jgi:hypothetical protein